MAASQGAVGPAAALQSQHYPYVAHWNPGVMQQQQQHPLHTARSLERALEDAVCSGTLNISGRKLRDYPGLNYDLTDTTQAGGSLRCGLISLRAPLTRFSRFLVWEDNKKIHKAKRVGAFLVHLRGVSISVCVLATIASAHGACTRENR